MQTNFEFPSDSLPHSTSAQATSVPGIQVSELLPRIAQHADKLAIVRSVHHSHSSHNSGMHWSIVGRPYRIDNTLINPSATDIPCFTGDERFIEIHQHPNWTRQTYRKQAVGLEMFRNAVVHAR